MKEKIKRYVFIIPSIVIMILMSLLPLMFCLIYTDKLKNLWFQYLVLALIIILIIFFIVGLIQTIYCMIHTYKNNKFSHNDKLKWYLLLFFFNILIMPCYYLKYIKQIKNSRNKIIIYLLVIVVLCIVSVMTSIYSVVLFNDHVNKQKEIEKQREEVTNIIVSNGNKFEGTFKTGFKKENIAEYDLYVKDSKRNLITGAFFYDTINYEEKTLDAVLMKQVEYIKSTRKDVKVYKNKVDRTYNNKTISTIELSGKLDDTSDCIYKLSCITFDGNQNNILYVIQVVVKKDYSKYNNELTEIINSINLKAN